MWTGGMLRLGYDVKDKKLIINPDEAQIVKLIFELYLKYQSIYDVYRYLSEKGIKNKEWTTKKGDKYGGGEIIPSAIHRILTDEIYIGNITIKSINKTYKGKHEGIISNDMFYKVNEILQSKNAKEGARWNRSPNLLSGKLYTPSGDLFKNSCNKKDNNTTKRYYHIKGLFLSAEPIDYLSKSVISDILNMNTKDINEHSTLLLKQINFNDMDFINKDKFIKSIIKKAIYYDNSIRFWIDISPELLKSFISDKYLNELSNELKCIVNNDEYEIIIERDIYFNSYYPSLSYEARHKDFIHIDDNNQLILKAITKGFYYRNLYDDGESVKDICKRLHITSRTFYKYINIAYISPNIINDIMSGKLSISVKQLFELADK